MAFTFDEESLESLKLPPQQVANLKALLEGKIPEGEEVLLQLRVGAMMRDFNPQTGTWLDRDGEKFVLRLSFVHDVLGLEFIDQSTTPPELHRMVDLGTDEANNIQWFALDKPEVYEDYIWSIGLVRVFLDNPRVRH
jgi:hypothetical protein